MPVDREAYLDNSTKTVKLRAKAVSQMKGDANGDGQVNVSDIMACVNYILGSQPERFIFQNADTNEDNRVNVSDIMWIVNYILTH